MVSPDGRKSTHQSHDEDQNDVARDWHKHQKRLPELYARAALDVERNLSGEASTSELFEFWMGGIKGAAYVLGADMYAVMDRNLGLDSAKDVIGDHRKLLTFYNAAARRANAGGAECFLFDDSLAIRVASEKSHDLTIRPALDGYPVAYYEPTYKTMMEVWRRLQNTLAPVTAQKSQSERWLKLITGGTITMWSLDNPVRGGASKISAW